MKSDRTTPLRIVLLAVVIGGCVLGYWGLMRRAYDKYFHFPYEECAADELLSTIEKQYGITIPKGIEDVNAARQPFPTGPYYTFVVRFKATPQVLEQFLDAFPCEMDLKPYRPGSDWRARQRKLLPSWYMPAVTGAELGQGRTCDNFYIYIVPDEDGESFLVYWEGYYHPHRYTEVDANGPNTPASEYVHPLHRGARVEVQNGQSAVVKIPEGYLLIVPTKHSIFLGEYVIFFSATGQFADAATVAERSWPHDAYGELATAKGHDIMIGGGTRESVYISLSPLEPPGTTAIAKCSHNDPNEVNIQELKFIQNPDPNATVGLPDLKD